MSNEFSLKGFGHPSRRVFLAVCLGVYYVFWSAACAVEETELTPDEQAILARAESYVAAFNSQDATAVATHWAEKGTYISSLTGEVLSGREAILADHEELFAENETTVLEISMNSLRFITPEVAIEDGTSLVAISDSNPTESNYTAVHVKKDGEWYIDSVREVVIPANEGAPLDELGWLIGEWVNSDEESVVSLNCEWTANKTFITRTFNVVVDGQIDMEGTQVIGWDAHSQNIRSWIYDSDGGFGEGTWSREGDRWFIKAVGILPSGLKASAVQILTKINDDMFAWQSTSRELDGEMLPNTPAITIVRKQTVQ